MCISDKSIQYLTLKNRPNIIKDEPNFQEYWKVSYFKDLYLSINDKIVALDNCLYSVFIQ